MRDDVESVLNELIETSMDGEKGFMKAAEDAHDGELKSLFAQCAQRCREGAAELQSRVRAQGGTPEMTGSTTAALHRGWISLKEAVSSREDKAILEECERGEDYAKAQYKKALEKDLAADVRAIVERQYQGVITNHDRVRALRDRYRAAAA
ncbi:MAG: PA2169 family four-helix-bundle protein [Casimicrobiaceae bacterium]